MSEEKNRAVPEKQRAAERRRSGALEKEKKEKKTKRAFPFFIKILIVGAAAFLLVYFAGYRVTINGDSMKDTLTDGQSVLVNRLIYKVSAPKEGDIIVFSLSDNKYDRSSYSVKRVVGEPGDVIEIRDGKLYINNKAYSSGKGKWKSIENAGMEEESLTVGENEYFVLGDDPASSEDSRFSNIGCISKKSVVGKVWLRIYPRSEFGKIN